MKTNCFLILALLLFAFQFSYAQTSLSTVSIKINKGKVFVSGIVTDEQTKNDVVKSVESRFGKEINFSQLKIDSTVKPFSTDWQKNLNQQLLKTSNWKSGLINFSAGKDDLPIISDTLMKSEILLTDNRTKIRLNDYKNQIIILAILASWAEPARKVIDELSKIQEIYSDKGVKIIGVSDDGIEMEKGDFQKFAKLYKIPFETGLMDVNVRRQFVGLSKFQGVPQVFVIVNGRLHGIFLGASKNVNLKLNELIETLVKKQNL